MILKALTTAIVLASQTSGSRDTRAGRESTRADSQSRAPSQRFCEGRAWSAVASAIPSTTSGARTAHDPSAAAGDRLMFAGNNIPLFDGRQLTVPPLTIGELGGSQLERPPGQFNFIRPRIAFDWSGQLHMLWAEPAPMDRLLTTDEWFATPLTEVWSAQYNPKTGWTKPARVFGGQQILWPPDRIRRIPASRYASESLVATLAIFSGEPNRPVILLRWGGDQWRVETVKTSLITNPVTVTYAWWQDVELVAFLAAARGAQEDRNSVFVQVSRNDGAQWPPAQLVNRSGRAGAATPQLSVESNGIVHLSWIQYAEGRTSSLRHSLSRDGGKTWAPPDELVGLASSTGVRTVIDGCGVLHAVFDSYAEGTTRPHLEHSVWRNGWQPPTRLFPHLFTLTPDLLLTSDGAPLLVFARGIGELDSASPYEPAFSIYRKP